MTTLCIPSVVTWIALACRCTINTHTHTHTHTRARARAHNHSARCQENMITTQQPADPAQPTRSMSTRQRTHLRSCRCHRLSDRGELSLYGTTRRRPVRRSQKTKLSSKQAQPPFRQPGTAHSAQTLWSKSCWCVQRRWLRGPFGCCQARTATPTHKHTSAEGNQTQHTKGE